MKIAIFGSSGHGHDIADIAVNNGYDDIIFLNKKNNHVTLNCFSSLEETTENISKLEENDYHFAIGVGEPKIRKKIFERYPNLYYPNLVHSSVVIGNLQQQKKMANSGNIFAAGVVITNFVDIGNFCFLGVNAVAGHNCILDDFVSVMPGAILSGNVHVQSLAFIGSNASIRDGTTEQKLLIGEGALIGMGAVVLKDVPKNHIAIGVPATNILKNTSSEPT